MKMLNIQGFYIYEKTLINKYDYIEYNLIQPTLSYVALQY